MTIERALLVLSFVATTLGCKIESTSAGANGFSCLSDEDCGSGSFCGNCAAEGSGDEAVGRCVDEDNGCRFSCTDGDSDGAFVGSDCPAGRLLDCEDENSSVSPTAIEQCDGVDNDCDGVVDEEQPSRGCDLQTGVCIGGERECVDGIYENCIANGAYSSAYEVTETRCDGLDNDCDGEPDEDCECNPATERGISCGHDTGPCTRGVRLCQADGSRSECVSSTLERSCGDGSSCATDSDCDDTTCSAFTCESDSDCSSDGLCLVESVLPIESLTDECRTDGDAACSRSICRIPNAGDACEGDDNCRSQEFCAESLCRVAAVQPLPDGELCNGVDDNCDGAIDNDASRNAICGPCPFNMAFLFIALPSGDPDFICVDHYEASRPDATEDSVGVAELYSIPRSGVLPWTGLSPEEANDVCGGVGLREELDHAPPSVPIAVKRLCSVYEWRQACGGQFPYSPPIPRDVFVAGVCVDATIASEPAATGSLPECCGSAGCDYSGNVAEYVLAEGTPMVAGGSYLDSDGAALSCGDGVTYEPVPATLDHVGFRCCTPRQ